MSLFFSAISIFFCKKNIVTILWNFLYYLIPLIEHFYCKTNYYAVVKLIYNPNLGSIESIFSTIFPS